MPTSKELVEDAKQYIHYEKDKKNKIAYLTFDRPATINSTSPWMRLYYSELVAKANIDDDVKVLVVRATGDDFGSGGDMPDMFAEDEGHLLLDMGIDDPEVKYPFREAFRYNFQLADFFADAKGGCRPLQEFKKISILETKGYCYGWHFYQAADADLVIASEDTLFGHPAFRYAGWGPRLWSWAETMGIRKFSEMLFTSRPFSAAEMVKNGFVNKVVPRDQLEAETAKYALACSLTRPVDTVVVQKTYLELYKQYRGEFFGSRLSGVAESLTMYMKPDSPDEPQLTEETYKGRGLTDFNKAIDMRYPPEWRLSRGNRRKP